MDRDRRLRAIVASASVVAILSASSHAFANTRHCVALHASSGDALPPPWQSAVQAVQRELHGSSDDGCARLDISVELATDGRVILAVAAEDGRRAERTVDAPADLAPTILGLMASIPAERPDDTLRAVAHPAEASTQSSGAAREATGSGVQVWVGATAGGRLSQPLVIGMLDFEGRTDVAVRSWLLFVSLRYGVGVAGTGEDATSYTETDLGLGVGKSFSIGRTMLDVAFSPSLATMRYDDQDEQGESDGSLAEFRLGASLRWSIPFNPSLRMTIVADTDVAPEGLGHKIRIVSDSQPLPAWTGGVRLGASGRLL